MTFKVYMGLQSVLLLNLRFLLVTSVPLFLKYSPDVLAVLMVLEDGGFELGSLRLSCWCLIH
jgi:uncharacterized protein YpmS